MAGARSASAHSVQMRGVQSSTPVPCWVSVRRIGRESVLPAWIAEGGELTRIRAAAGAAGWSGDNVSSSHSAHRVVDSRSTEPAPFEQICRAERCYARVGVAIVLPARRMIDDRIGPARRNGTAYVEIVVAVARAPTSRRIK
eukprot:7386024-Prymnesium_polylepis.1